MTIEKYMGPGGDTGYEDFGSAMNTLAGLGNFTDNYKLIATADFLNTTACLDGVDKIHTNGYGLEIDFNGKTITTSEKMLVNSWSLDYSTDPTVKGQFYIHDGYIQPHTSWPTPSKPDLFSICGGYFASPADQCFHIYNMKLKNTTAIPVNCLAITQASGQGLWLNARNIIIFGTGVGYGIVINGNGSVYWPSGIKSKYFENIAVYTDRIGASFGQGIGIYFLFGGLNTGWAVLKNVYSSSWYYDTFGSTCDVFNCADGDDSLITGIGNVHGVTTADFVSVDPTSADFLKIPNTSLLAYAGTSDISSWNTEDYDGNDRPDVDGLVSIGAREVDGVMYPITSYPRKHTLTVSNGLIKDYEDESNDNPIIFYFGEKTSEGVFRIRQAGGDLLIEKNVSGSWVEKGRFQ
jgi:hypothetical protein